jgi:hypothetical protein
MYVIGGHAARSGDSQTAHGSTDCSPHGAVVGRQSGLIFYTWSLSSLCPYAIRESYYDAAVSRRSITSLHTIMSIPLLLRFPDLSSVLYLRIHVGPRDESY